MENLQSDKEYWEKEDVKNEAQADVGMVIIFCLLAFFVWKLIPPEKGYEIVEIKYANLESGSMVSHKNPEAGRKISGEGAASGAITGGTFGLLFGGPVAWGIIGAGMGHMSELDRSREMIEVYETKITPGSLITFKNEISLKTA